uniref:Uncharacterized protein n=1 Tax=Triticum urartu TaxID=4572 RepID=A0A8R7QSD3_TRIUA
MVNSTAKSPTPPLAIPASHAKSRLNPPFFLFPKGWICSRAWRVRPTAPAGSPSSHGGQSRPATTAGGARGPALTSSATPFSRTLRGAGRRIWSSSLRNAR